MAIATTSIMHPTIIGIDPKHNNTQSIAQWTHQELCQFAKPLLQMDQAILEKAISDFKKSALENQAILLSLEGAQTITVTDVLGHGASSVVYKGEIEEQSNQVTVIAIKCFKEKYGFFREREMLNKMSAIIPSYLIPYKGWGFRLKNIEETITISPFIALGFVEYRFEDVYRIKSSLIVLHFLHQLLDAVLILSESDMVHNDLKVRNMGFRYDEEGNPKIVIYDTDAAIEVETDEETGMKYTPYIRGTRPYLSPEKHDLLEKQEVCLYNPVNAEIWSCAIAALEMYLGISSETILSSEVLQEYVKASETYDPDHPIEDWSLREKNLFFAKHLDIIIPLLNRVAETNGEKEVEIETEEEKIELSPEQEQEKRAKYREFQLLKTSILLLLQKAPLRTGVAEILREGIHCELANSANLDNDERLKRDSKYSIKWSSDVRKEKEQHEKEICTTLMNSIFSLPEQRDTETIVQQELSEFLTIPSPAAEEKGTIFQPLSELLGQSTSLQSIEEEE